MFGYTFFQFPFDFSKFPNLKKIFFKFLPAVCYDQFYNSKLFSSIKAGPVPIYCDVRYRDNDTEHGRENLKSCNIDRNYFHMLSVGQYYSLPNLSGNMDRLTVLCFCINSVAESEAEKIIKCINNLQSIKELAITAYFSFKHVGESKISVLESFSHLSDLKLENL